MSAHRLTLITAALVLLWSCGESTAPGVEGLTVLTAPSGDTIQARPVQALTVEIRGPGGERGSGKVVRFQSLPGANGAYVRSGALNSQSYSTFLAVTANEQGRASALIAMAERAGVAPLEISAPELGLADTVEFTITAGAPSRVQLSFTDTTMLIGQTYAISAAVTDRFGNARSEQPTVNNERAASCGLADGQITPLAMGRCLFTAKFGEAVDTARGTAVPPFRLAMLGGGGLVLVTADGGARRLLVPSSHFSLAPAWSPDASRIVIYEANPGGDAFITVVDTVGARLVSVGRGASLANAYYARYSPDGQWIYFSGRATNSDPVTIWRMRPDGTQLERFIAPSPNFQFGTAHRVHVAADNASLIFDVDGRIAIASIATREVTPLGIFGLAPSFSPDGQRIAYVGSNGQGLWIADRSGANVKSLSTDFFDEWQAPQWTADGTWLLTSNGARLVFVNVSDASILPLELSSRQGAIRPPLAR